MIEKEVIPKATRLQVARDMAQWHLGDASWADEILNAYFNPENAQEHLKAEGFYDDE